jgi:hypothetical protein
MDDFAKKIQSAGSGSSNKRRLDQKTKRGNVKALRRKVDSERIEN